MTQERFSQHPAALGGQVRKWGNDPLGQEQAGSLWQSRDPANRGSSALGLLCPGVTCREGCRSRHEAWGIKEE